MPEPLRRVTMTVTGYLHRGRPIGGWYDMNSAADGNGQAWSIPEFAVDETTVTDAPPETLTASDWLEIEGHVLARLGKERGRTLLNEWRNAAADA